MATAAAIALLAGISTANAQNAPTASAKSDKTMEQSGAPNVKSSHKTRIHQSMRMRRHARETTGFGGQVNDPSIHQPHGDRDSRDFPKQH
jgi:hypothetical protein